LKAGAAVDIMGASVGSAVLVILWIEVAADMIMAARRIKKAREEAREEVIKAREAAREAAREEVIKAREEALKEGFEQGHKEGYEEGLRDAEARRNGPSSDAERDKDG
jgi:flagellar biosynthesis/type III secretory pathway protein FliH